MNEHLAAGRSRWWGRSRALGGVVIVVLSLAGRSSPAAAQISDGVVKLGVLTNLSGISADNTGRGSVVAAQMAVEDYGGSVRGKPIELVFADHLNKPDVGLAIARRWLDAEKVDAIVDVPISSIALAVQGLTRERKRVFLISGGGSSDLTGKAFSPYGIQWTYDTFALANVAARALIAKGLKSWYFVTADYAFGHALERDATAVLKSAGGRVVGTTRHPFATADFSSFLLQAQASGAQVIALANSGDDTLSALKQAVEFGLTAGGQQIVGLHIGLVDTHALGLKAAQGMVLTDGFYWDADDEARAWSNRFFARHKAMPTMNQAGVYSAVTHYLRAIDASGTDEAGAVVAAMRAKPVNDFFAHHGVIRQDGRMVHDMYLMQAKAPAASKGEWDLYEILARVPGEEAFRSIEDGECPIRKEVQ
jgi:branched-chain amino acid transport system substrate-binding protein